MIAKNPLRFVSDASFWEPEEHGLSIGFTHAPFIFWLFGVLKPIAVADQFPVGAASYVFKEAIKRHELESEMLCLLEGMPFPGKKLDIVHLSSWPSHEYLLSTQFLKLLSDISVILVSGPNLDNNIRRRLLTDFRYFYFDHGSGLTICGKPEMLPEQLRDLLSIEEGSKECLAVKNTYRRLSNLSPNQQLLCSDKRITDLHEERFKQIRDREFENAKLLADYESLVHIFTETTNDLSSKIEHLSFQNHCLSVKNVELDAALNRSTKTIHRLTTEAARVGSVIQSMKTWRDQSWRKRLFDPWQMPETSGS